MWDHTEYFCFIPQNKHLYASTPYIYKVYANATKYCVYRIKMKEESLNQTKKASKKNPNKKVMIVIDAAGNGKLAYRI